MGGILDKTWISSSIINGIHTVPWLKTLIVGLSTLSPGLSLCSQTRWNYAFARRQVKLKQNKMTGKITAILKF